MKHLLVQFLQTLLKKHVLYKRISQPKGTALAFITMVLTTPTYSMNNSLGPLQALPEYKKPANSTHHEVLDENNIKYTSQQATHIEKHNSNILTGLSYIMQRSTLAQENGPFLAYLPQDILSIICLHLKELKDLYSLSCTCRSLNLIPESILRKNPLKWGQICKKITLTDHPAKIVTIASIDQEGLAIGYKNGSLGIWNLNQELTDDNPCLKIYKTPIQTISALTKFNRDTLILGSSKGTVTIFELNPSLRSKQKHSIIIRAHKKGPIAKLIGLNDTVIISITPKSIALWNVNLECKKPLTCIQRIKNFRYPEIMFTVINKNTIATVSQNDLEIINTPPGATSTNIDPLIIETDAAYKNLITVDEKTVALIHAPFHGQPDFHITLWNTDKSAEKNREILTISHPAERLREIVKITPSLIASVSSDTNWHLLPYVHYDVIRIWNVSPAYQGKNRCLITLPYQHGNIFSITRLNDATIGVTYQSKNYTSTSLSFDILNIDPECKISNRCIAHHDIKSEFIDQLLPLSQSSLATVSHKNNSITLWTTSPSSSNESKSRQVLKNMLNSQATIATTDKPNSLPSGDNSLWCALI